MTTSSAPLATERRWISRVGALIVFFCLIVAVLMVPSGAQAADPPILFGATPPRDGNAVSALRNFEAQLGKKLGLVRVFLRWDEAGRGQPYHDEILDGGRAMHLSVRAKRRNGPLMTWNSIANAQPGSQIHNEIVAWADYLKGLDGEIWFTFNQEPEIRVNDSQGSPQSFRAAYRKVHQVFQQRGATNVQHAWVMSNYAYELQVKKPGDRRAALQWYPGDDVVDLIGSDPYDWSNCRTDNAAVNRPMGELVKYFLTFAQAHPNERLVLGEWAASANRNVGSQAGFIDGTRELFKRPEWSRMAGLSYFATNDPTFPNCIWDPRGSAASMQALRNMQNDAAYGGANGGGNPPPPPQGEKLTNVFDGAVNSGQWRAHYFTPSTGGNYRIVVKWNGSARLRSDIRVSSNNAWLGADISESSPLTYNASLQSGQRLQLAVWSRGGSADYDVEVWRL
ncbi:MAG: hypothetical protein ACN4GZ_10220 [Acidimicrobiales bacterium]